MSGTLGNFLVKKNKKIKSIFFSIKIFQGEYKLLSRADALIEGYIYWEFLYSPFMKPCRMYPWNKIGLYKTTPKKDDIEFLKSLFLFFLFEDVT